MDRSCSLAQSYERAMRQYAHRVPLARGGALLHLLGQLLLATPTSAGPADHWAPPGAAKTVTVDIATPLDPSGREDIGLDTEIGPLCNGTLPKPMAAPPGARWQMFEGASATGSAQMGGDG